MEKRSLGKDGPSLVPLGLGCMGLSGAYGKTDDENSIRVTHAALERGISLLNTGDFYGIGHNEFVKNLQELAATKNATATQLAFAWV
jgi:aryl-alcohol dehydrogenase-like predicted oxidoreductase